MKLVLDTSVLIAGDPVPAGSVVAVASVSIAELTFGVAAASTGQDRALRQAQLDRLSSRFGTGLPFDDDAARAFGPLCALVLAAGRDPRSRSLDLMIAATAFVHGAGVLTRNPGDFTGAESLVAIHSV